MGGNAVRQAGRILLEEIPSTLDNVSYVTGISREHINNNLLGSVGKKSSSGDIDIAMPFVCEEEVIAMTERLEGKFGENNVFRRGKQIHFRMPIADYDESVKIEPRTGYVQVDLLYGEPEFMKVFNYSPSETESKFTGTHRNLGIISICRFLDRVESDERDDQDRPVEYTRWKWSPTKGLVFVKRKSKRRNDDPNKWCKGQTDEELTSGTRDEAEIIETLFQGKCGAGQIDSLEKIIEGINIAFEGEQRENMLEQVAFECKSHRRLSEKEWDYPVEIKSRM